jgi:uncharacterized protein YegP (UPF0339 family)
MYRFKVYQSSLDRQWYWRFVSPNGEITAIGGEGYSSKQSAIYSINLIAGHGQGAPIDFE